jgi:hypothetical protein
VANPDFWGNKSGRPSRGSIRQSSSDADFCGMLAGFAHAIRAIFGTG